MTYHKRQEYPKFLYHPTLAPQGKIFQSFDETQGLALQGWVDTPAKFPKSRSTNRLWARYKALGLFEKFGVWAGAASIAGLIVSIVTLRPAWIGLSTEETLLQTGTVVVQANVSDPTIEVYYPIPYETPPELTWTNMPYYFVVREQRADGFKVQFTSSYSRTGVPTWRAKGIRQHR